MFYQKLVQIDLFWFFLTTRSNPLMQIWLNFFQDFIIFGNLKWSFIFLIFPHLPDLLFYTFFDNWKQKKQKQNSLTYKSINWFCFALNVKKKRKGQYHHLYFFVYFIICIFVWKIHHVLWPNIKSKAIYWQACMSAEALPWKHKNSFVFISFSDIAYINWYSKSSRETYTSLKNANVKNID